MKTIIKSLRTPFLLTLGIFLSIAITNCSDADELGNLSNEVEIKTRAVPTIAFDWENVDWMPTPSMQSRIPTPWVGQGSLVGVYGFDVVNDRKAINGWELLYSTFDEDARAPLVNPYFILYNKYRGIMRIYLYLTTSFVTSSSYIQDGISIIGHRSSMLNYLGGEAVDISNYSQQYMQIQPAPKDGSLPLASNRWYMLQYEIAYDPNLENIPYNEIQMSWTLNYYNIQTVELGGRAVGKLNGVIGKSSNRDFFTPLVGVGQTIGTGVLAGIGRDFITNNTIDKNTGENKLGLSGRVFEDLSKGISSALSAASGNLPGAVMKLFSAIIGGSSETPISMNLDVNLKLTGTGKEGGAFPSTPSSFWVPGTFIPSNAVGYIPLYNKSLGVLYLREKPVMEITKFDELEEWELDPQYGHDMIRTYTRICYLPEKIDFSSYLVINPEVLKVAKVEVLQQDLIKIHTREINPTYDYCPDGWLFPYGVRFIVKVSPKDGSQSSILIKTFNIDYKMIGF